MKRLIAAAFVLLMATPALAGMNIRQNSDGSTDWVDASGNAYNVGTVYLTAYLSDVSDSNVSAAVASPITNAKITLIQTTLMGQITGTDAVINVYAGTGITSGSTSTSNEVSNGSSPLTITACTTPSCTESAGTVDSLTPTTQNGGIEQGGSIIITTNGASTNSVGAMVVIVVEPDGD